MSESNKKLYPNRSRLIKTFILYAIVLLVLIYGIFSSRFAWAYKNDGNESSYIIQDVIVIIIYMILAIVSLFILFKENYYVILNDGFVHHRWVKDLKIRFNEILYIDEEYTKKNKTILFYTDKGSSFFMILDDEDKLYNLIKEKSKNLMSKEQYHKKFPKISL